MPAEEAPPRRRRVPAKDRLEDRLEDRLKGLLRISMLEPGASDPAPRLDRRSLTSFAVQSSSVVSGRWRARQFPDTFLLPRRHPGTARSASWLAHFAEHLPDRLVGEANHPAEGLIHFEDDEDRRADRDGGHEKGDQHGRIPWR